MIGLAIDALLFVSDRMRTALLALIGIALLRQVLDLGALPPT